MSAPYWLQVALIVQYLVIAAVFASTKAWPVSIYYFGCFVKDIAVLALALIANRP